MYPRGTGGLTKVVLGPEHYYIGSVIHHGGQDVLNVHDIVAGDGSQHALFGGKPNVSHIPISKLRAKGATFHAYVGHIPDTHNKACVQVRTKKR